MGLFVSYDPNTYAINGRYVAQSDANEAAQGNPLRTALVGEQMFAIDVYGDRVDALNATNDGTWFVYDAENDDEDNPIPRLRQKPRLSPLEELKSECRLTHQFFIQEVRGVVDLIGEQPIDNINAVRNLEYRFHQGFNAVIEDKTGARRMNEAIAVPTIAQKITIAQEVRKGASDITTAKGLVEQYPVLTTAARALNQPVPPQFPLIYVDPRTQMRVTAGVAVLISGPRGDSRKPPDSGGVNEPAWNLVQAALELSEPPLNHLRNGDWINRLVL